jgi:toxin ParE1/3/4
MRRVRTWLDGFDIASERGTLHGEIRPGLRIVGFERRIAAAFLVDDTREVILRLFYGGQDWGMMLGDD